jgi:hypothetical protein
MSDKYEIGYCASSSGSSSCSSNSGNWFRVMLSLSCFYNSIGTLQKNIPRFHKVVPHYKIITVFNT